MQNVKIPEVLVDLVNGRALMQCKVNDVTDLFITINVDENDNHEWWHVCKDAIVDGDFLCCDYFWPFVLEDSNSLFGHYPTFVAADEEGVDAEFAERLADYFEDLGASVVQRR
jgi:hypothetical protein